MEPIYDDLTRSLGAFLITGLGIGFATFLGLEYINAVGGFTDAFRLEATAIVVMVAISSFFISPTISAFTGAYIGYREPDRGQSIAFSTFAAFLGFFVLNIVSVGLLLSFLGLPLIPETSNDPSAVFFSFVLLENRAAFLSFPSVILGLAASYLGSDYSE